MVRTRSDETHMNVAKVIVAKSSGQRRAVAKIATHHRNALAFKRRRPRRIACDHAHLVSRARQTARQMSTCEPGGPGYECAHRSATMVTGDPRIRCNCTRASRRSAVAVNEGDPTCRGDLAGYLPGAHCGAPQPETFAVAVGAPEFRRPRVRLAPGIDDATRLGVLEVDTIGQRHALKRTDGAAEAKAQGGNLADAALRLRYRIRICVQDVGGRDSVDIR